MGRLEVSAKANVMYIQTRDTLLDIRITERKGRGLSVDTGICLHDSDRIVVEDRRDIFRGELVGGVTDEKTCLADSTVTDNDAPIKQAS